MKPLILITNDDGFAAKGLRTLDEVAMEFGDVIVMAPEHNSSGKSHSLTTERPLRVREIKHTPGLDVYACTAPLSIASNSPPNTSVPASPASGTLTA